MKNAKSYEPKIKKLLAGLKDIAPPAQVQPEQHVRVLIHSILLADATSRQADKALAAIEAEFVDFNELRVTQAKEIVECVGEELPDIRRKADVLVMVLNGLFDQVSDVKMEHLVSLGKRDARRHLRELGCPPFAEAVVSMRCYDTHTVPVDDSLRDLLEMKEQIHPGADLLDTQAFLERIITQKKGPTAHEFFRQYVAKNATILQRKRQADAEARQAEADAQRAAEEKEAKEAAKRAAQAAAKQAEEAKQAEKAKKAKAAKKSAKKAAKKKPAPKKAVKKVVKKTPAKKVVKKVAKTPAKKSATKKTAPKKVVKKVVKKVAKTPAKKAVKKVVKKTAAKKVVKKTSPKKAAKKTVTKKAGKKKSK